MRISGITYASQKSYKTRTIVIIIILIILLIAIAIASISAIAGWRLTHPVRMDIPAFSSNIVPDYKDASFKDINKKLTLKGWLFETKGSDKTIILAHGYKKNRLQFKEQTLDMIKDFINKGYNVLTFDFRNSGVSDGDFSSLGLYEKDDLLGAIKYVKSKGSKHIVLMGFSTGASTSILAAAESKDIDAVIADSPFSDLNEFLSKALPTWSKLPSIPFNSTTLLCVKIFTRLNPSLVSPKKVIPNVFPKPVLFIHSKDDTFISVKSSEDLYNIYSKIPRAKAELWETHDVDHVQSYEKHPKEYMDRVFKFLDSVYAK